MKRKISALLAADIVKYSRLVADDEEETVHRLADYRAVFEEVTSRHGGRIVNMVGDAVLADFSSSVDAVRCALDVQQAIDQHNRAFPDDRRMQLRIGVTLADIMDQEGELFGDGVNIAARLESLAPPGGICVSQTVAEQVSNKLPVAFTDIGPQRVKNIPTPIHAFVFVSQTQEAGANGRLRLKGMRSRKGRLLGAAALAAACAAAVVVALQFREPGQAARWMPASLASQPAATAAAAVRFDGAKVRALADKQGIPLPQNLKVLVPAASVPAHLANYLGAWGGDRRWSANGRQVMLIVESVDESGTALGFFAHSALLVPNPNNVTQNSARFVPFAATLNEGGLHFLWGQAKYTFHLRPDGGAMFGDLDMANSRHFSIVLDRIE